MNRSPRLRSSKFAIALFAAVALAPHSIADEYAIPDPSRTLIDEVEQAYERAEAAESSGDVVGSTAILEWVVFESHAGLAAATLKEIEITVESAGISRAIKRYAIPTGVVTRAYSELGERYLTNGYAGAALPLLSVAAVQRSRSLLDAIQAEDPSYEFETLSHALVRARNIRNTFKYLNEIDVLKDPNLYRDLLNLGLAMRQTDSQDRARTLLGIVAGEAAAGPLRDLARKELEAM
ncbi:MAG: hypothetical protein ACLFP4_11290 [Spirochaetales bacterium]